MKLKRERVMKHLDNKSKNSLIEWSLTTFMMLRRYLKPMKHLKIKLKN